MCFKKIKRQIPFFLFLLFLWLLCLFIISLILHIIIFIFKLLLNPLILLILTIILYFILFLFYRHQTIKELDKILCFLDKKLKYGKK